MSDAILAFRSQLSGVMETVFKAAMYEITRLVEDSFVEEVSRSKEQVESLKQRLQWFESRRRERQSGGRTRCVDCGRVGVPSVETVHKATGTQSEAEQRHGLKQEKALEGRWISCPREGSNPGPPQFQEVAATPSPVGAPSECTPTATVQQSNLDGEGLESILKEEALQTAPPVDSLQDRWAVCLERQEGMEGQEGAEGAEQEGDFGTQQLRMCEEEEWECEAGVGPGHEGEGVAQAYEARYDVEEELGVALDTEHKGEYMAAMLGDSLAFPSGLDPANPANIGRGRRAGLSVTDSSIGELDCLLINEDGFLQEAERRHRGPRRGRGRSRVEHRSFSPGGDVLLPSLGSSTQDCHRGEPFGLPSNSSTQPCDATRLQDSSPELAALRMQQLLPNAAAGSPYTCTQCGKGFTQACNLKVHQRIHSGQGLHLCSHCGRGFLSFTELKRHKCSHGSEKPYCCSLCGNKFSRLWNLKLHRRIHTQEKPHRCTHCGKSFTRADILKVHQRTHTGERPYSCTVCGLSFKRLDHLKSHQRKHS
ncbi:hypothetical protein GJAV_G00249590 [Gymnothorax javanicus]|nr:hypothetical protein GJAV_G00249590 [Gymnothorax javanicus]